MKATSSNMLLGIVSKMRQVGFKGSEFLFYSRSTHSIKRLKTNSSQEQLPSHPSLDTYFLYITSNVYTYQKKKNKNLSILNKSAATFLWQTSFLLSNDVSTCRVLIIRSREEDDGWIDEWTLKDRRSEGVGGAGGVRECRMGWALTTNELRRNSHLQFGCKTHQ